MPPLLPLLLTDCAADGCDGAADDGGGLSSDGEFMEELVGAGGLLCMGGSSDIEATGAATAITTTPVMPDTPALERSERVSPDTADTMLEAAEEDMELMVYDTITPDCNSKRRLAT